MECKVHVILISLHVADVQAIGDFKHIKIGLDSEAQRTQTKERKNERKKEKMNMLFNFFCVFSKPYCQADCLYIENSLLKLITYSSEGMKLIVSNIILDFVWIMFFFLKISQLGNNFLLLACPEFQFRT